MNHINKYDTWNERTSYAKRSAGIILPIFSLSNEEGIGTLGDEAYDFVDFLHAAKQTYWQILPIGPTTYGDSPYQSFSTFAGNPYFINLKILVEDGLLSQEQYLNLPFSENTDRVDYLQLYYYKMEILRMAYQTNLSEKIYDVVDFYEKNKGWLDDYALFMALKQEFHQTAWYEWPIEVKMREQSTLTSYREKYQEYIRFQIFVQYVFFRQYQALKQYATENQVKIIGDIPIYVAADSADCWSMPQLFQLTQSCDLKYVGGCPPDAFSQDGQLWGNPVYDWEENKRENYAWWMRRIGYHQQLFDVLRIDHFRGFEAYWKIPKEESTARNGIWEKGPGYDFFHVMKTTFSDIQIIAEDLGFLTEEVHRLRTETGFPGMKILLFAMDSAQDSEYLPHNVIRNCVYYTGTHDNDTIKGWINQATDEDLAFAVDYLKLTAEEGYVWGIIRACWQSVADLAICQLQDILELDSSARTNMPSTLGNWTWRMPKDILDQQLAHKLAELTELYRRA